MIVYRATNRVNGKSYIGKTTKTLHVRRTQHEKYTSTSNVPFHRALRKYGIDNFDWTILAQAESEDELNRLEIAIIAEQMPHYNATRGGDGLCNPSAEVRKKMSDKAKGHVKTPEQIEKWRRSVVGRKNTLETRLRISTAKKGKAFSESHKLALKEAWRRRRERASV
jgi:group I intron endonuclease